MLQYQLYLPASNFPEDLINIEYYFILCKGEVKHIISPWESSEPHLLS